MSGDPGRRSIADDPLPEPVQRALAHVGRRLFAADVRTLSPPRAALLVVLRLGWLTVRGFFRERIQMRAASLAFATVLAFVPAAALAFAVADALGATTILIEETIEPFLAETLGSADDPALPQGVRGLRATLDGLLTLVRSTHVTGLGIFGLIVVLWSIARVLIGVDEAFAHVFQHRGPPRSFARRMRAFAIVTATAPLGLTYAMSTAIVSHGHAAQLFERFVPFAPARDLLLVVLPPIVVTVALLTLYMELPDAEIRPRSAFAGAIVAALAWYALQLIHIRFQVSLARWNAIYSGFGAFPIMMLSIHVSWVIVLLGAQLIAAHQDAPSLEQLARGALRDHGERQALAIRAAIALAQRGAPIALRRLARHLGVPASELREVLDDLAAHDLVATTIDRADRRYSLAIDPAALSAGAVLDALERTAGEPDLPWDEANDPVRGVIVARRAAASSSGGDRTIAELAAAEGAETIAITSDRPQGDAGSEDTTTERRRS
jgi:membrane protein